MEQPPAEFVVTESDRKALEAGYYWDQSKVDHVLKFAATLRDPMDADKPYRLLAWQLHETRRLFGWRKPNGRRRFTRLNVWVPKKNGKTSWLAFLALYFLLADGEKRPGCYVASATGELSGDLHAEAKALTAGTRWRRILDHVDHRKLIKSFANGGEFKALAASADGAEGLRGSFVCVDEIHATLKKKPKLYASLRYAGSGRKQPLTATISTAGDDRQSLPFEIYTRAKQIITGEIIDLHTLCCVFEAEDQDEYTAAELAAANPGIGEVLEIEQLVEDYNEAKTSDFNYENFKRYRLNVWTKRATAWLDVNKWIDCCNSDFDFDELDGAACFVGVDLSSRLDLTAAVAVFRLADGRVYFLSHFWLPKDGIENRCVKEMDFLAAATAGHMTLTDGAAIDFDSVRIWIETLAENHDVQGIGFDPYKAAALAKELEAAGFECFGVKQGWLISEPCLEFERLLETKDAIHTGNTVMAWCVENVEKRTDNNGKIRAVKPQLRHKRIDGVIGAVNGLYLAMFADTDEDFDCG